MKKKLIILCATLLLTISGSANAALTTDTITDTITTGMGWLDGPGILYLYHSWTFNTPLVSIDSATLDIVAKGVSSSQGEVIPVTLDGQGLGNLTSSSGTQDIKTTNFDLSAVLSELNDELATVTVTVPDGKDVRVDSSTLTINYTYGTEEPPPPPPPVIPAPGAVLLSSIGVGLVGWLRRRRTL